MKKNRPTNQDRGLEEDVRQPVVPNQSAANVGRTKLDGTDRRLGTEPLRRYDLTNLYGKEGNVRQPVRSSKIPAIDKRIKQARADMKEIITTIKSYEKIKANPPQELIEELKKTVKNLHSHTLRRIHYMHSFSEEAFKFVLEQDTAIRFIKQLPTAWTAPLAAEIRTNLVKMQKSKLAWQMERLRRTNHPVWMKPALVSLANLQALGIDVSKEIAEVMALREEYWKQRVLQIHPNAVLLEDGTVLLGKKSTRATDDRGI